MGDAHRRVSILLAVLLLAAGCADRQAGVASAPPSSPTSTAPNRYGAPSVEHPLDVRRFLTDPCATLTPAQLARLDLPGPGNPDTSSALAKQSGPSCTWRNSPAASRVAISYIIGNENGLADIYRAHAEGDFQAYWIPTTVEGYPAVFKDDVDSRKSGSCRLDLGVSDTVELLIDEQDQSGEKSCDRAYLIATFVIATLRGG